MNTADQALQAPCGPTVFTLRLRDGVHRCAVSDEALYLLSQKMDPRLDQVDAYLKLKWLVAHAAQACLDDGAAELPPVMEARHLIRSR